MNLKHVSLDDKYTLTEGRIFITGTQALVRLPMTQHLRDQQQGHRTAGYITGYRGSPLGGFDDQLTKASKHLDAHHTLFVPGVNENLAATVVWGTQQAEIGGEGKYDGVFGLWYGKGPGVDGNIVLDRVRERSPIPIVGASRLHARLPGNVA